LYSFLTHHKRIPVSDRMRDGRSLDVSTRSCANRAIAKYVRRSHEENPFDRRPRQRKNEPLRRRIDRFTHLQSTIQCSLNGHAFRWYLPIRGHTVDQGIQFIFFVFQLLHQTKQRINGGRRMVPAGSITFQSLAWRRFHFRRWFVTDGREGWPRFHCKHPTKVHRSWMMRPRSRVGCEKEVVENWRS
jgi:hypothetical protein